jgi:hypothetical protein
MIRFFLAFEKRLKSGVIVNSNLGGPMFENTPDEILLTECKVAVQTEKQSTARVLEYLVEIDSRRRGSKRVFLVYLISVSDF